METTIGSFHFLDFVFVGQVLSSRKQETMDKNPLGYSCNCDGFYIADALSRTGEHAS